MGEPHAMNDETWEKEDRAMKMKESHVVPTNLLASGSNSSSAFIIFLIRARGRSWILKSVVSVEKHLRHENRRWVSKRAKQ